MKKWTKAEREEASRQGKLRWAARKKRSTTSAFVPPDPQVRLIGIGAGGGSGGSANASSYVSGNQALAIDVVRLIGHDVPADVIVKVVERILRP